MKDLAQKLEQCKALIGTTDINVWDNGFLIHVVVIVDARGTTALTGNQVTCLERIHNQHFG